jgi:hypothetical protein
VGPAQPLPNWHLCDFFILKARTLTKQEILFPSETRQYRRQFTKESRFHHRGKIEKNHYAPAEIPRYTSTYKSNTSSSMVSRKSTRLGAWQT